MNNIKRFVFAFCIVICSMMIVNNAGYHVNEVYAHSGRTDSQGGHKDNKNKSGLGSYHYHHGYPAHLHTNGVCPYEGGGTSASSGSAQKAETKDTITVQNYDSQMHVGEKQAVTFQISSNYSDDYSVTSSDGSVIAVSGNELIAKNMGTATITVKSYNNSKKFTITVKPVEVTEIKLSEKSLKLLLGNEQKISAVVNPENATDKSVTWYSENEGVVTVSDGRITAVGEGTAVVTAKASNGVSASMTVEVLMIEPDSIKTSGDDLRVEMRDTASMDIEILPKDSIDKTYELSEWDDQIVNIRLTNDTVELMPVSEGRTALLIETWNGIEKRIPIEVYSVPMEKIEIDDSEVPYMGDHSIDIENGEFNLNCKIIPENCTYPDVQWKSSDEDVIKVSDGVFQVIGKGTTTITCESVKDDGVYSQIEIQVVDKAEIVMTTVLGAGFLTVGGIVGVRKYKKRKRKSSGDSEK